MWQHNNNNIIIFGEHKIKFLQVHGYVSCSCCPCVRREKLIVAIMFPEVVPRHVPGCSVIVYFVELMFHVNGRGLGVATLPGVLSPQTQMAS